MTTDARELAALLANASDSTLATLFSEREISPRAPWRDFFDVAEALLEPLSIGNGISRLSFKQLENLQARVDGAVTGPDEFLLDRALVARDGSVFTAVAEWLAEHKPTATAASADGQPSEPAARAAERAFTTIGHLADLLSVLLATPLAQIGTGAVSAADRRRLAETGVVDDPDNVDVLLRVAEIAGLARSVSKSWMATHQGAEWLGVSNRERWGRIATAAVAALPAGIRDGDRIIAADRWSDAYPLMTEWPARVERIRTALYLLGIVTADGQPTPWSEPLLNGAEPDVHKLAELVPHEVSQIYLQNDLTAISPGPLDAVLDIRLRTMAVRESHAQASSYRFTPASLMDAVTGGETAETIREFLEQISLTGIPQPLAYLVEETQRRHGTIRVQSDESGRTEVTAESSALLDTMAVDQILRPLGFIRSDVGLTSRVARDVVAVALADAHYPVTLLAADGSPQRLKRHRIADDSPAPETPFAELIERLREGENDDSDAAWLERELELAVRQRSTLAVTVSIPGEADRTFHLEAAGLGGGRLRGRDKAADVERTLPLSHITKVTVIA